MVIAGAAFDDEAGYTACQVVGQAGILQRTGHVIDADIGRGDRERNGLVGVCRHLFAVAHGGRYLVVSVQVELKGGHSVGGEFVFPVFDDDCHRVVVGDVLQCQFPVFEGMDDGVFAFDVGDDVASRSFPLVVGYSNIYRMSAGLCHSREGKQQHEHAK